MREKLTTPSLEPIWKQSAPNDSIELGSRNATVCIDGDSMALTLHGRLLFGPRPCLMLRSENGSAPKGLLALAFGTDQRMCSVSIDEGSEALDAYVGKVHQGANGTTFELMPSLSAIHASGRACKIRRGYFHLLNAPEFSGSDDYILRTGTGPNYGSCVAGRAFIEVEDYRIELGNIGDSKDVRRQLEVSGGYFLTGIGKVERVDGDDFSVSDFEALVAKLHSLLSFAFGRWSGICLLAGFNRSDERVFEEWGTRFQSSGTRSVSESWFYPGQTETLSELAPGYFELLDRPVWKDEFHRLLWWYLAANDRGESVSTDMALIPAQAALESLAWLYCVRDKGLVSEDAFRPGKLKASDQLRMVTRSLGLPAEIPASLGCLSQLTPTPFKDIPHAITELRNDTIHPKRKREYQSDVWYECLKLALWQIELIILRLSGYEGKYMNRLRSGFAGMHDELPWAKS